MVTEASEDKWIIAAQQMGVALCVCVCVCVCACVRACVHGCVRACVHVCETLYFTAQLVSLENFPEAVSTFMWCHWS